MLDELQVTSGRLDRMAHDAVQTQPGFVVLSYIPGITVGHIVHSDPDDHVFTKKAARDAERIWS